MEGVADDVPGDCGGVEYSGVWVALKRYPSQKQKTATTVAVFIDVPNKTKELLK
jgi:hypothetical protein